MKNRVLDAEYHLDMADAFKPGDETAERAAIEATIGLAFAVLAAVERIEALTDAVDLPLDEQGRLSIGVNKI